MNAHTLTAIALLLAASACNRQPAANNAGQTANSAQNAVVAAPAAAPVLVAPANTANMSVPEGDIMAGREKGPQPSAEQEAAEGCAGEIGLAAARRLADQCRDVSPATRPPCNTANNCALIREEIQRGCGMLGDEAPEFCPH